MAAATRTWAATSPPRCDHTNPFYARDDRRARTRTNKTMMEPNAKRRAVLLAAASICAVGAVAAAVGAKHSFWQALITLPWLGLAFVVYLSSPGAVRHVRPSERRTSRNWQIAEAYRATTEALAAAIAAKDTHEQRHVRRVQSICELIARQLGLSRHAVDGVRVAALVHDVGKLGVPEHILLKPGPLDPEEFAKIANHAAVGAKILEQVEYPWNVAEMVRHHHERYDGSGYPDHLTGDQIPLGARIIAVAEVYDALVSDRCYKTGWPHQQAIEHIEKLSRSHFDPRVVNALVKVESEIVALAEPSAGHASTDSGEASVREDCGAADVIAQANQELMSLMEIAETLSSTLELDEVLGLLAHRTRRLSEAATCAVFVVDESCPRQLVARVAVGRYQEAMQGAIARVGKGVTGKAVSRLEPYLGSYDPNDLSCGEHGRLSLELKSCVVAPISSFGKLIGAICLYDDSLRAFCHDDLRTLVSVANRAALAIQNATAFESVRDSALKDPVTGLYNGRYLRGYLEHEINRAARRGEQLSVLGMDLESFKAINDSFGHSRGDTVLRDAATVFQRQLRDYDLVVRNGGDEFVVVLPGTPASEAVRTALRIQKAIENYAQRNLADSPARLGVSVGVATYPDDALDIDALLARADSAMYRDKRARKQGRLAA